MNPFQKYHIPPPLITTQYHRSLLATTWNFCEILECVEIWLIHIGNFFKQEASDFFLAPMDTGIFYSTIQIGDFLKREQKLLANKWVLYPFK